MSKAVISLINLYRLLSDLMRAIGIPSGDCRFSPTCSHYAEDAVRKYGVVRGITLAIYRILRCNPFSSGGHDPVS